MASNWKQIDEKLIRRGELILDLGFVEHYREELEARVEELTDMPRLIYEQAEIVKRLKKVQ